MKVLVVDDSKAMRLILRRSLRQAGFGDWHVQEAESGRQALECIRTEPPDLVLSAWNMPGMTGIDLMKALRSEASPVRVGLVTSEGSPKMRAEAFRAGALFLLAKPFAVEDLQATLSRALVQLRRR